MAINEAPQLVQTAYKLLFRPSALVSDIRRNQLSFWTPVVGALVIFWGVDLLAELFNAPPARRPADAGLYEQLVSDSPFDRGNLHDLVTDLTKEKPGRWRSDPSWSGFAERIQDKYLEMLSGTDALDVRLDAVRALLYAGSSSLQMVLDLNSSVRYEDQLIAFLKTKDSPLAELIAAHAPRESNLDQLIAEAVDVGMMLVSTLVVLVWMRKSLSIRQALAVTCYLGSVMILVLHLATIALSKTDLPLSVSMLAAAVLMIVVLEFWTFRILPRGLELPVWKTALATHSILLVDVVVFGLLYAYVAS